MTPSPARTGGKPRKKRGDLEVIGDQMFVQTGYTTRTEVVEHLMKPVMPFIAHRVKLLLTAAAKMFPDKCPHCGGEIQPTRLALEGKEDE